MLIKFAENRSGIIFLFIYTHTERHKHTHTHTLTEAGSFLNSGFRDSAGLDSQLALRILSAGVTKGLPIPSGIYMGAEDLHCAPHGCAANTLLREPCFQPQEPTTSHRSSKGSPDTQVTASNLHSSQTTEAEFELLLSQSRSPCFFKHIILIILRLRT